MLKSFIDRITPGSSYRAIFINLKMHVLSLIFFDISKFDLIVILHSVTIKLYISNKVIKKIIRFFFSKFQVVLCNTGKFIVKKQLKHINGRKG